jgi:hypothetical protein
MALKLSKWMVGDCWRVIPSSERRWETQVTSTAVEATAQYSVSVEERNIVLCFYEHQEIGLPPRKRTKAVIDL